MTDELSPPKKSVELEDPGAHELDSPESDDHFSDASEGRPVPARSGDASPIPITRVERVDDEPSYGEVPGTDAYKKRINDAVPDEVEVVPDGSRSRSASRVSAADRPTTPGGSPVPKTVVERVDDKPAHGEIPGTHAHHLRLADAEPDVIVKVPEPKNKRIEGMPTASLNRSPTLDDADSEHSHEQDDDDFGDDFDEFEEGEDGDDFGDFDDGFHDQDDMATSEQPPMTSLSLGLPVLDFDELSSPEDVAHAAQPYIDEIFPSLPGVPSISAEKHKDAGSIFLSERSLSLWTQLIAPPPLQPPDWVRSRIRRLFLVSLGVPVDLDEILPASKQKKLILPSIQLPDGRSPRDSGDDRTNGALARVKKENASSASVDSSSSKTGKRKGPPPPPQLDISATSMLCSTTEAALANLTDEELQSHVKHLQELTLRANEVFEYWTKRMESALGDKEAFEGVIENLVMHAKKVRK